MLFIVLIDSSITLSNFLYSNIRFSLLDLVLIPSADLTKSFNIFLTVISFLADNLPFGKSILFLIELLTASILFLIASKSIFSISIVLFLFTNSNFLVSGL